MSLPLHQKSFRLRLGEDFVDKNWDYNEYAATKVLPLVSSFVRAIYQLIINTILTVLLIWPRNTAFDQCKDHTISVFTWLREIFFAPDYIIDNVVIYHRAPIMKSLYSQCCMFKLWRGDGVFRCSPSSRQKADLVINIGGREKRKPLQRSHCIKSITTKPLQSNLIFSYLQLFYTCISWEFKQFIFSFVGF